jgi:hypothetical protein
MSAALCEVEDSSRKEIKGNQTPFRADFYGDHQQPSAYGGAAYGGSEELERDFGDENLYRMDFFLDSAPPVDTASIRSSPDTGERWADAINVDAALEQSSWLLQEKLRSCALQIEKRLNPPLR